MRKLIILPLAIAFGCGDKDEDTGSESLDTAAEDTAVE